MAEHDSNTIRAIAWSEVFPWLNIVRVFRVAIAPRVLVLAAVAILITAVGWAAVGTIFGTDSPATSWLEPFTACPWRAVTIPVPDRPAVLNSGAEMGLGNREGVCVLREASTAGPHDPVSHSWGLLVLPATEGLQNTNQPIRAVVCLFLCGLVSVAVWAFFGAAICRIAAVQLAADEQVGVGAAVRFACKKWPAYFAAPLFPVGGALLAAIPVLVLGLIMKLSVGMLLGGLLWPLALVAGLLMTLLLAGVLFGWPLMWATISAEGTDSFDALSRSYAYLFQRPLHYLFYAFVAGVIGWLGWLLVQNFAAGVVWMAYWSAGWGSGGDQIGAIIGGGTELSGLSYAGAVLVRFWAGCVKLLAVGFLFSYFWTAAVAIYFLLRRDVDATEMDEVYLDADASEHTFGLPTVTTDQAGAPVVKDDVAETKVNEAE
jgi:hypothetical protein